MLIARLLLLIFFLCIPRILPLDTGSLSYLNTTKAEPFSYIVAYNSHHDNKSLKKSIDLDHALLPEKSSAQQLASPGFTNLSYHERLFALDTQSLKKARAPPLS